MRNLLLTVLGALVLTAAAPLLSPSASAADGAGDMLPDALIRPVDRPGHILVVDKSAQMLYLYRHDGAGNISLDRIMPCSTGENLGDKLVEGDRKTPNGFYIFNQKLLPRELSPIYGALAYPTDYPNFWDRALGRGGYGIWLHGINKPLVDYDSNGCIELENADIARLEDLLSLYDTPLITYETLTLAPAEELRREGAAVLDFLESWRQAWVSKDQTAYRAKYAKEFVNSDGRSFEAWMGHKELVAKNYKNIKVELKNLRVYRHRDVLTAAFEQDYLGDQRFSSVGLKRLYIKKSADGYRIVGEEFKPLPSFDAAKKLSPEERRLALTTPPLSAAAAKAEPEGQRAAVEAKAAAETPSLAGGAETAEDSPPGLQDSPGAAAPEPVQPEPAQPEPAQPEPAKPEPAPNEIVAGLVEKWAQAWSDQSAAAYFAFYHPDFRFQDKNMNLADFKAYRAALMSRTAFLKVKVSNLEIQVQGEEVQASFQQDYRSDQRRDRGLKTLVFKKSGDEWKILSETWREK